MIFARRSIQRFLDQLSEALPREAVSSLIEKLNRNDRASLDFEWEVAVLFALSRLGKIAYEADHGGDRRPDVTFSETGSRDIAFVADIATVSDRGLADENPVDDLSEFLRKKARKLGLPGTFDYHVDGAAVGNRYADRKMKLAMPTRKQLPAFLEKHVTPWLKELKARGTDKETLPLHQGSHKITITYDRHGRYSGGGYLSYTAAYSLTRNPVYTSLKSKTQQLRDSGFDGCKGIILCDGNCALLKSRMTSAGSYSPEQVIGTFFRDNTSLAFVATLWVERTIGGFGRPGPHELRMNLSPNPGARFPLSANAVDLVRRVPAHLPRPATDALNASIRIEEGKYGVGDSHYGGRTVGMGNSSGTIRMSARALLELLAGNVDPKRFIEDHGFVRIGTGGGMHNPFEVAIRDGRTIDGVTVERQADEDDDWITFKLSGPDVAISPFRAR